MKILTFTNTSDKLLADWKELWNNSKQANIFNSPEWFRASQKAFGKPKYLIITVYDDAEDKLKAIACFLSEIIFGVQVWTSPAREFADRPSILTDTTDTESTGLLFQKIGGLTVYLPECTDEMLNLFKKHTGGVKAEKGSINPYINLSGDNCSNLSQRKINILNHRADKFRGRLAIDIVTKPDKKTLRTVFDIDRDSVKQAQGKGVFYRTEARDFYMYLFELIPQNFQIAVMYFDGKPAAYVVSFIENILSRGSQKAYKPGHEYFSPGRLMLYKLILFNKSHGFTEMDLGRGYDRLKQELTSDYRQLYRVVISKNLLLRFYISVTCAVRELAYRQIESRKNLYKMYKKFNLQLGRRKNS